MARRKKAKKSKSHTPAVRHLRYQMTGGSAGSTTSVFVDLAHDLSLVNRRLYRQGKHYFIKKVTITSRDTDNGIISISAAPTSWVVSAAWKKAFTLWNQMRKGHGGAPGSGLPRGVTPATWADFKVYLDPDHRLGTVAHPMDNVGNTVSTASSEWVYSKYQSPDGSTGSDEFTAHLLGANVGSSGSFSSVGIVEGYEHSRRTVQQDDSGAEIDTDSWMINLFDDGTTLDEIADDLKADGDLPPYSINRYPGGSLNMPGPIMQQQKVVAQYNAPGGEAPSVTLGAVQAPCGLLEFKLLSDTASDVWEVLVEVAAGDYKGVKALDM